MEKPGPTTQEGRQDGRRSRYLGTTAIHKVKVVTTEAESTSVGAIEEDEPHERLGFGD